MSAPLEVEGPIIEDDREAEDREAGDRSGQQDMCVFEHKNESERYGPSMRSGRVVQSSAMVH